MLMQLLREAPPGIGHDPDNRVVCAQVARVFDAPLAEGLATLRRAQEEASPQLLVRAMAAQLDPATVEYLLDEGVPGASARLAREAEVASEAAPARGGGGCTVC